MPKVANQVVGQVVNQSYLRPDADEPKLGGRHALATAVGHLLHGWLDNGFRCTTLLDYLRAVANDDN